MSIYTVQRGDSLSSIARRHNLASWRELYEHPENAQFRRLRPNPNVIQPGDQLYVPGSAGQTVQLPRRSAQIRATNFATDRSRRVASPAGQTAAQDPLDVAISEDQFGVRLRPRTSYTVAEMRRLVWPDGYVPPEQVLLPAPTVGDEMMNSYNQRNQVRSSLIDRSPRYSQFVLNLTTFGHSGNPDPIWSHMRPDLRQRILAQRAPAIEWPNWLPPDLCRVLEQWLSSERAPTEAVRFEHASYPRMAPHPAIVVYIHSGTAVDLQVYAEAPIDRRYYERRGAGPGEAQLLADVAQQINEDMMELVDRGFSPERARHRLTQIYRDRLLLTILEAIKLVVSGASRFSGGPPGGSRPVPPRLTTTGSPRNGEALDEAVQLARAETAELGSADAASGVIAQIRTANPQLVALSDAEILAIREYSGEGWAEINLALRTGSRPSGALGERIRNLLSGLQKLPGYRGRLVRSESLPIDDAVARYVPGHEFRPEGMFSTSRGGAVAQREGTIAITIEAIGRGGRDISSIAMHSRVELEILFAPGTRFFVEEAERIGMSALVVKLREL